MENTEAKDKEIEKLKWTCGQAVSEIMSLNSRIERIHDAYSKYVTLLTDEMGEVISIAYAHGWVSKRFDEGTVLRKQIDDLLKEGKDIIECSEYLEELKTPIRDFDISFRLHTFLNVTMKIKTLGDIIQYTKNDFESNPNFCKKSMKELESFLESKKMSFKKDILQFTIENKNAGEMTARLFGSSQDGEHYNSLLIGSKGIGRTLKKVEVKETTPKNGMTLDKASEILVKYGNIEIPAHNVTDFIKLLKSLNIKYTEGSPKDGLIKFLHNKNS